jgi:hypothetical protein
LPLDVTVLYSDVELEPAFTAVVPIALRRLPSADAIAGADDYDYVVLFESSGMYNGEDVVSVASYLASGRLDAVWGSRRLSVLDIEASMRLRYEHHAWLRIASALGSHALSAACLVLYGRYVSDTLSGVRAVRAADLASPGMTLGDRMLNHRLLARLLGRRGVILETPVQFLPMSPGRVRRTSVGEGLRSLAMMIWWRIAGVPTGSIPAVGDPERAPHTEVRSR